VCQTLSVVAAADAKLNTHIYSTACSTGYTITFAAIRGQSFLRHCGNRWQKSRIPWCSV